MHVCKHCDPFCVLFRRHTAIEGKSAVSQEHEREVIGFFAFILWMARRQNRIFQEQMESGILQPVRAEFQGYTRQPGDDDPIDVPVYRCIWNGRAYRLETGSGRRPYRPGDVVILYRDRRDGSVTEAPKKYHPAHRAF